MSKGGPELLADPVAQELLTSAIPARLAYVWTDGSPRVVPIWFHWDGRDIVMGTFVAFTASMSAAPKMRALKTGHRVALTIDTNNLPHRVLSIRGVAEVTEVDGVIDEYAKAAERYFGEEEGRAYIEQLPDDIRMGRIAVRPDEVVVLDFETRFPSALS